MFMFITAMAIPPPLARATVLVTTYVESMIAGIQISE